MPHFSRSSAQVARVRRVTHVVLLTVSAMLAASCRSVQVADPCPTPLDVPSSGVYCGVNTQITPWAKADAYWEGATFQSETGHGVSHDVTITFDAPVSTVEVTAYDPTFTGNAMKAYNAAGALVGTADFPGNQHAGELTMQTRTISGSISKVTLIAAPRDYVGYSMRVKYRGR